MIRVNRIRHSIWLVDLISIMVVGTSMCAERCIVLVNAWFTAMRCFYCGRLMCWANILLQCDWLSDGQRMRLPSKCSQMNGSRCIAVGVICVCACFGQERVVCFTCVSLTESWTTWDINKCSNAIMYLKSSRAPNSRQSWTTE